MHDLKMQLTQFMDQIWNRGDFSELENLVSAEYTISHDPGDQWEGQTLDYDTFKKRILYSRNAFPDLRFDIQEMVAEKNKVAATWIMSGTHLGDLDQLPASGRPFAISGMTIYDFDGGKVQGHWQAFDRLGFLSQIGFLG